MTLVTGFSYFLLINFFTLFPIFFLIRIKVGGCYGSLVLAVLPIVQSWICTDTKDIEKNRNHFSNIICLNPPFDKNASIKVAKRFLNLIEQNLPKSGNPNEKFNRNTVKVSCSCKQKVSNIIKSHNKRKINTYVKRVEAM